MPSDIVYATPFNVDSVALSPGMLLRISANNRVVRALADAPGNVQGLAGVNASGIIGIGGPVNVVGVAVRQKVLCETGLTLAAGETLYVSATVAGRATNVPPALPIAIGSVEDVSSYMLDARVYAALAIPPATAGGGAVFPGFGTTPPNIGSNVGTAGVATTAQRSDARPGQDLVAQWAIGAANRRVYLVDVVNGNDANPGFLDGGSANFPISGATIAATAKQTIGALDLIFPRFGNGRHVEVIIANGGVNTVGTYADGIETFLSGYSGYAGNCPLVRATGTNTTAGATAFAGDAADVDYVGGITVTGLNAAGYTPTGTPTTQVVQCTLFGGGAPALPAEPLAPLGWRIRFDSATATAALRNICRMVAVVTTDTITTLTVLPAVPALTDKFYLEQSGVTFGATTTGGGGGSFSGGNGGGRGAQIVGMRCTGAITLNGVAANFAFAGCTTLGSGGGNFIGVAQTYQSATLGSRTVGGGCHMTANFSTVLGGCYFLSGAVAEGFVQVLQATSFLWALGSVAGAGMRVLGGAPNNRAGITGIGAEPGQLACRILGSGAQTAALGLGNGQFVTGAIQITDAGAKPAVFFDHEAHVTQLPTTILSGATGNTDVGLAFVLAVDTIPKGGSSYNSNGNANTLTGGLGDVRISNLIAGGQIVTWAQLNATGLRDGRANQIIGSTGCGPLARLKFSGSIDTSAGGATIAYLSDPGAALAGAAVNLAAQRYPTSVMLAMRLRVTKLTGAGVTTNNITCTLYQNGAPTTMVVTVLAADPAGTKYVDSAHPILFVDGDDFDLRLDDGADVLAGTLLVSACLEYTV